MGKTFFAMAMAGIAGFAMVCAAPARAANGVVGPGNCTEAGFDGVLSSVDGSGGGTITFNCGTKTITFTNYKRIAHAVVIDGGGTITLDGNNASPLFQIYASATATLRRITLQHGVNGDAHAIENFGTLTFDRARVLDNVSAGSAVMNYGTMVVRASTFSGNRNTAANDDGGAIYHQGAVLRVDGSTFNGNRSARKGSAIYSNGVLIVTNATFNANNATGGGTIYQTDGTGLDGRLTYVTLAGNSAAYGGGFYKDAGDFRSTLTVSRSIIANNTGGNCDGASTSGGYNLWFGSTSCAFNATGDGSGDPKLGALGSTVGSPTQTMLPGSGSAAIGRIPNAQCQIPVDQRGGGRPFGSGCDSGAVEAGAPIDLIFYDGFE